MAKIRNWMNRPDPVRQLHSLEVPIDVTPDDLLPDEASAKLRVDIRSTGRSKPAH